MGLSKQKFFDPGDRTFAKAFDKGAAAMTSSSLLLSRHYKSRRLRPPTKMRRVVVLVVLLLLLLPAVVVVVRGQLQPTNLVQRPEVRMDRRCYTLGEALQVSFAGAFDVDDWVGVVPAASLDHSNLVNNIALIDDEDITAWAWKCQPSPPCQATGGTVAVGSNSLPPGEYVAVLAHSAAQGPYVAIAASPVVTVAVDCFGAVAPTPTPPAVVAGAQVVPTPSTTTTTSSSSSTMNNGGNNAAAARELGDAWSTIALMIAQDHDLAPKMLRLFFHDCIGGCDGCVDLNNHENFGLEKPIDALEMVFQQHGRTVSRADVWALGATVAVAVTQVDRDVIDFPFSFWGRQDCTAHSACFNANHQAVPCTPKHGPHHEHPSIHLNTVDVYHFFATEYGLSAREAIVAMAGGHTIGKLAIPDSGINGPNGWVKHNTVFDNEYFHELIGGSSTDAPLDVLLNDAPLWRRVQEPSTEVFHDRRVWEGFPTAEKRLIMLNTDVALFRDLNPSNYNDTNGQAFCGFERITSNIESVPICPHIHGAVMIGAELKHNNLQFKTEFRSVLEKMLSNGYERVACGDVVCKLVKKQ